MTPPSSLQTETEIMIDPSEMERMAFHYGGAKNGRDAAEALAVCSEEFTFEVATGRPVRITGWEKVRAHLDELWTAIPDLHTRVDWTVAESSRLVAGGMLSGSLHGEYFGAKPAGQRFEVPIVSVLTFANGKLIQETNHVDMLSLLHQIGVLTAP